MLYFVCFRFLCSIQEIHKAAAVFSVRLMCDSPMQLFVERCFANGDDNLTFSPVRWLSYIRLVLSSIKHAALSVVLIGGSGYTVSQSA